ncbi:MAG: hypothetical protein OEO19_15745 [Gammaproteobacteria bacterium]|nr:hypothetical protein [Gammaproteobacteria bacterium]MDH3448773.1 hypothetical protein [Gammaproteobacteria bacterium]
MAAPVRAAEEVPADATADMPMKQYGGGMMMPGNMMPMIHSQMMGGGMGQMMNPQMMQMRMQHMHNIEQQLKNIEALLQQLVDQGKSD